MKRRVIVMSPAGMSQDRRKTALSNRALSELTQHADVIDLERFQPEDWPVWWSEAFASADETILVIVADGAVLGFRQQQRAYQADRLGVPVYILWQPNAEWRLQPISEMAIRFLPTRSLAQFAEVSGG